MKVKVTHPIVDAERVYQPGHVYEIDPHKAAKWIEKDWCYEVENEEPQEVKRGKKSVKEH